MLSTFELHGGDSSPTCSEITTELQSTTLERATRGLPWFMSISLAARPRCFGCGGRLLPKVVVVQGNFALCDRCERIDWSDYRPHWLAIESLGSPLELSRSRGIIFWTPPITLPEHDAYLRWIELWDIMRGPRPCRSKSLRPPFVDSFT